MGQVIPPTVDRPASIPAVAGATRITFFFGTHTHGELVRPDGVTFAHYAAKVNGLRAALPDRTKSLFVGNGDDLVWNLCGAPTNGAHVIESFNAAGLDADTYGFNEVAADVSSIKPDDVRKLIATSRFAWLSANVRELDGRDVFGAAQGARRYVVRDLGGVKVGLTGLIVPSPAPGFTPPSYGRDLSVIDPSDAMREVIPLMRRDGAQLIVVLSHMDGATMERVAREVPGIDAIIGSHIWSPNMIKVVGQTLLVEAHDNMHTVGQLDLFVRDGKVVEHAFGWHAVTAALVPQPEVAAVLERYIAKR
jgi:5'-nucleotidase/UDP-sugar diphosphatase